MTSRHVLSAPPLPAPMHAASNPTSAAAGALPATPACTHPPSLITIPFPHLKFRDILSMYRHPSPNPPPPHLPWHLACLTALATPAPTPVEPGTFSDYSCIGPSPFLSSSDTSQVLKKGFNRQRICILRNACVVDVDVVEAASEPQEFHPDFFMKSLRLFRPRRLLSSFSEGVQNSSLEQLLYQPATHSLADGEGLVHLHAWENHHGGDPSADLHVLGASPSVSYSAHPALQRHPA